MGGFEFDFHCRIRLDLGFFSGHLQILKLASSDQISFNAFAVFHFDDFLCQFFIFVNVDEEGFCLPDHLRHGDFVVLKIARGCITATLAILASLENI